MRDCTEEKKKDYRFCSQCKRSKYARPTSFNKALMLYCEVHKRHYEPKSEIDHCPDFVPEKAEYRSRDEWVKACVDCKISIEERGKY